METTQTIKIWKSTLRNLRLLHAESGESMVKILDRAVSNYFKNTEDSQVKVPKRPSATLSFPIQKETAEEIKSVVKKQEENPAPKTGNTLDDVLAKPTKSSKLERETKRVDIVKAIYKSIDAGEPDENREIYVEKLKETGLAISDDTPFLRGNFEPPELDIKDKDIYDEFCRFYDNRFRE